MVALTSACGGNPVGPTGDSPASPSNTPSAADIQISELVSSVSPNAGAEFFYTFAVMNLGPGPAANVILSDALPVGVGYNFATVNGDATQCSIQNMTVSCGVGTLAKGAQATVVVDVNAPVAAGALSNGASVISSVADPQTINNSATATIQVNPAVAACSTPSGETTFSGLVMWKGTNSFGLFEDFGFSAGGVNYTVLTNFYDGGSPLTTVINLDCKQSPVQFTQVGNFVNVTGTVGSEILPGSKTPTPVIHASIVQVLTHKDRGA